MKYIKTYEQDKYALADIENINLIKNKKYLFILEFYLAVVENKYLELNIPIDIYYVKSIDSYFTTKTPLIKENTKVRHFYKILGMWMSLKKQSFKTYKEAPYFMIDLQSEEFIQNPDFPQDEERFFIRQEKYAEPIIDAIYKYAKEHEELLVSHKFNL